MIFFLFCATMSKSKNNVQIFFLYIMYTFAGVKNKSGELLACQSPSRDTFIKLQAHNYSPNLCVQSTGCKSLFNDGSWPLLFVAAICNERASFKALSPVQLKVTVTSQLERDIKVSQIWRHSAIRQSDRPASERGDYYIQDSPRRYLALIPCKFPFNWNYFKFL